MAAGHANPPHSVEHTNICLSRNHVYPVSILADTWQEFLCHSER